jgi:ABC-type nickel/cobalt efflux system permease component RcnA
MQALAGWAVGLLLGMRHALEPDHLAAVSTLVSEERSPRRGFVLGALWGAGHTLALLGAGLALAVLEARISERLADLFELGVALMLIALGARALHRALRLGREGHAAPHAHDGLVHHHSGPAAHVHVGRWTLAARPLLVGLVHGLAGSGALTALVLAGLHSTSARLVYIALFGVGSAMGMALLSGAAGWPLARMGRNPAASRGLTAVAGLASFALGVFWGWPLVARMLSGA